MRTRHKPPALVSMWMLDVFCCALGCVTLLFLLNSRMAADAVQANRAALVDLQTADRKLAATITALEATKLRLTAEAAEREKLAAALAREEGLRLALAGEAQKLRDALAAAETEQDDTKRRLDTARADAKAAQALLDSTQADLKKIERKADATAKDLAAARAQAAGAADLLAKRQKEADLLSKRAESAATQMGELQKLVRVKDEERERLAASAAAVRKELIDLEAKLRATQRELDANLNATKAAAKAAGDELAQAREQIKDLTQKANEARATIIDLQGDKAKLADKFDRFQKESESRFAGIAMTGSRVVFLVDTSGSMGKRDLNAPDDTKWPMVVETVCKVMRSVPTLERFQVVTFSSRASWLFGAGEWQPFEGEGSARAVRAALLAVKPRDDTNMHAGLDTAFGLRAGGLDTIYLFSDGLPTSGPGLTPAQQALPESERGALLGKEVRELLARRWNRPEANRPRVKINSVGFYFESVEVGAFLWALSRENEGSFVGMSKP